MKSELLEKLAALENELEFNAEEARAMEKAMAEANTREDVLNILSAKGIEITEKDIADMISDDDELSEDDLEDVAGGGKSKTKYFGFFRGMSDSSKVSKGEMSVGDRNTGNTSFLYQCGWVLGGFVMLPNG